jgi:hypothetical protein
VQRLSLPTYLPCRLPVIAAIFVTSFFIHPLRFSLVLIINLGLFDSGTVFFCACLAGIICQGIPVRGHELDVVGRIS